MYFFYFRIKFRLLIINLQKVIAELFFLSDFPQRLYKVLPLLAAAVIASIPVAASVTASAPTYNTRGR